MPESRSKIVINGKFLSAELNGVHRTAAHYASLLISRARSEGVAISLVAPEASTHNPAFPLLNPEVYSGRFGTGQGWEMLTLPQLARDSLLVNFCNLAPLLHKNTVVMIHDAQTYLHPEDYTGRQAAGYRLLSPYIGRRARRVLTVSEFSRKSLVAHGIGNLDKIDVIHNGTDHILQVPADTLELARHGLEPGSYVMVFGSTKGYKNIRRVFAAMSPSSPDDLRLVVAGGPGADAYHSKGWTPPKRTVFTGYVTDAALRALYEGARLFAFPSLTEGFGLPPVEAMHCGTPVVAARAGAISEVCGDGVTLVDPKDTAAWRSAIDRLATDPVNAEAQRLRGSRRAAKLTWDAAGETLWHHISPLL